MRTFPSAQPQRTVSTREGWAESGSCSDPPACPGTRGTWGSGTGHKSTAVAPPPNIFEFFCVYIFYTGIYISCLYTDQIKSRISLCYTVSVSRPRWPTGGHTDPVLPYTLSIWSSDIYLKTKARAWTLSQVFVPFSCDGGHSLLPYG